MKKRSLIILLCAVICVVCVCVVAIMLIPGNDDLKVYTQKISTARELFDKGEYEEAIRYYKQAIKLNDEDPDAYRGLGDVYVEIEDYEEALKIYQRGYEKTGSERLKSLVVKYTGILNDGQVPDKTEQLKDNKDKKKTSGKISLNSAMINNFADYVYSDYVSAYGSAELTTQYGACLANYPNFVGTVTFENIDNTISLDSQGYPLDNAVPASIMLRDVSVLFIDWSAGITYDQLRNMGVIGLQIGTDSGVDCVTFRYGSCTISIESDKNGNIVNKNVWNKIVPDMQTENEDGRKFTVDIVDAATGYAVEGDYVFQISAKSDVGSSSGVLRSSDNIIDEETVSNGVINVELPDGDYVVCLYPSGNEDSATRYEWTIDSNTDDADLKLVVANTAQGEIVIVLKWGEQPRDLDAHLFQGSFNSHTSEVSYMNKNTDYASLDVDCMDGNGIETITITDTSGDYSYFVNNYSMDGQLSESGATVEVFVGGESSPRVFKIPSVQNDMGIQANGGWYVFDISNGEITEVNSLLQVGVQ